MNRRVLRMVTAVVASAAVGVALAGCSPIQSESYVGKTAVQAFGGDIRIKVCEPISAKSIRLSEVADQSEDLKGTSGTLFAARGSMKLTNDSSFTTIFGPENMVRTELKTPKLRVGDLIILHINGRQLQSSFTITKHGLPTTTWLRSDGTDSKTPCDGGFFGA